MMTPYELPQGMTSITRSTYWLHPVYPECGCAHCQAILHPAPRYVPPPPDYVPSDTRQYTPELPDYVRDRGTPETWNLCSGGG